MQHVFIQIFVNTNIFYIVILINVLNPEIQSKGNSMIFK